MMESDAGKSSATTAESVFGAAMALPPSERMEYVARVCGSDLPLRATVEALLQAHEAPEGFLPEQPGQGSPSFLAPRPSSTPSERPGQTIGRYKLLEKIGEGGCGVVYMAEQEEPVRRRVALKIIKLGMDTQQVVARFEAERQALALMDHPNIAKVLDAGATESPHPASGHPLPPDGRGAGGEGAPCLPAGRPYFVMELVGGVKITEYCEQNHLTTRQRLDLFIQVCRAIQHAHQKGIIHRDIKPSNVLVTTQDGAAVPKVIDFGIAKATQGRLTDETLFTAFEQFLGTPAYMSPEQAQLGGLDVDTRSDIYSLGVLLYELLTGKTPFDAKEMLAAGLEAMRRTIQEKEPPTPSTRLTQALGASKVQLRGFASRRPKSKVGRPGSEGDRASLRRLQQEVRGDLDWIVMKCLEKDRARRYETANGLARDLERHLNNEPVVAGPPSRLHRFQKLVRRNRATATATAIVALVLVLGVGVSSWQAWRATRAEHRSTREAAKSQQVAKFLTDMLEGVGPSVARGRDTTMLREILDKAAERVNKELTNQPEVQLELRATLAETYEDLGLDKQMETMTQENVRLARSLFGEQSLPLARALEQHAAAHFDLDDYEGAATLHRTAVGIYRNLLGEDHRETLQARSHTARLLGTTGKQAEAEGMFREVLAKQRRLFGNDDQEVVGTLDGLSNTLWLEGKLPEAESTRREHLRIIRKLSGNDHPDVAHSVQELGWILHYEGKLPEAEAALREALALSRKLFNPEHPSVAGSLAGLARVLTDRGQLAEAEAFLREALALSTKASGQESRGVAMHLRDLANVFREQGRLSEAEAGLLEALTILRKISGNDDPEVATFLNDLGVLHQKRGNFPEAEAAFRESLAISRKHFGNEHADVAGALKNLGYMLKDTKPAEAETMLREALATSERLLGSDNPRVVDARNCLAQVLQIQGKLAEAETLNREALAAYSMWMDGDHPGVGLTLNNLGSVLSDQHRFSEAETMFREALSRKRRSLGEDHPEVAKTVNNLAFVLLQQGKTGETELLFREALRRTRDTLPAGSPALASLIAQLAGVLLMEEKFEEAEPLIRECLAIREEKSPDDWLTFSAQRMLGSSLLGQRRYAEAEPLLLCGYEGMEQREANIPGGARGRLREALQALAELYEVQGHVALAAEWKKKLEDFEHDQGER
jgi:serine/threonine protein kinase/Tfp pilus assembly protein PilF